MGGLGNQIFQLAAGIYLHQKHGREVNYPTTLLHPPKYLRAGSTSIRNLMIGELIRSNERVNLSRLQILFLRLFTNSKNRYVVTEKSNTTESLIMCDPKTRIYIGYFQQLKYVNSVATDLLERFSSSATFKSLIPKSLEPRVAIHIRLGDYSSNQRARSFHGLSDISYFVNGAIILLERLQIKSILIVSDEPKRAKLLFEEFFDQYDVQITCSSGVNEYEDLALLSHSAGLVASNSSFSWWAAWLSSPLGSQVIVPSPWFAELSLAEDNLFDSRWTVIDRQISNGN
jgi:hypothetical protein